MKVYTLYEGQDSNDNDMVTNFRKPETAMTAFRKTRYPYAVVHVYEDEDYIDTLAEKKGEIAMKNKMMRGCGESLNVRSSDNCPDLEKHDYEVGIESKAQHIPTLLPLSFDGFGLNSEINADEIEMCNNLLTKAEGK